MLNLLMVIFLFLFVPHLLAQTPVLAPNGQFQKNYIINGDFETGNTNWNFTGTVPHGYIGTPIEGKQSLQVTAISNGSSFANKPFTVPMEWVGRTCYFGIDSANGGGSFAGYVTAYNSGVEINSGYRVPIDLPATGARSYGAVIPCPITGTAHIGVVATVNSTNIAFDKAVFRLASIFEVPSITSMKSYGAMTITSISGGFTLGTVDRNILFARQVGDMGHVHYELARSSTTGFSNGSGYTLFSLPSGMEFDSSKYVFDTSAGNNRAPISSIGNAGNYYLNSPVIQGEVTIVPYDSTRFRVLISAHASGSNGAEFVGGTYTLGSNAMTLSLDFYFSLKGASNSATVINAECPNGVECEKTLSATVTSGGVVDETDYDWINGSVTFSSGTATINLNSIGITQAMKCGAAINEPGATAGIRVESVSTSQIVVKTYNLSAVGTNVGFKLDCTKAKVDFRGKRVLQAEISNMVKSDTGRRLESISYRGATTGTNCTSSPCGYDSKTSGISTLVRDASGNYTVNFSPACTEMPSCSVMATNGANTIVTYRNGSMAPTLTTYSFSTAVPGGSISDTRGDIICTCK